MQKKINVISITSNEFKFKLNNIACSKVILIGDGKEPKMNCQYQSDETIVIINKKISGSYYSRNVGLNSVKNEDEFILLIDDDVIVDKFPNIEALREDVLYVPYICVEGKPKSFLEKWYIVNAFDQKRFVKNDKFAPTITWLFNKKDIRFDSSKFTGNDVTTSKLFDEIVLLDNFHIITKLRDDNKIKLKFLRQATGHINKINFISWIIYILKNIILGNGLHNLSKIKVHGYSKKDYLIACYVAGFYKSKSMFLAGLNKYFRVKKFSQENINKKEIEQNK